MTHNIISVEEFKNRAFNVIPIPGFKEGDEPIFVQIRATGVMSLIANGRIPNTLLGKVTELFGGGEKVEKDKSSNKIYVFVNLLDENSLPEFFLIDAISLSEIIEEGHKKWLITPNKKGGIHNDTKIREFSDINGIYKNNWKILDNF